jgi:thioredoxin 1
MVRFVATICFMAAFAVCGYGQEPVNKLGGPYNGLIGHSQQSVDAGWVPDARKSETKPWNRTNTNTESTPVDLERETERQQSLRRAYQGRLDRRSTNPYRVFEATDLEKASTLTEAQGNSKVDFTPEHIKKQGNEKKNYLVMISADWCIWCKKMYPMLLEMRKEGYIIYIFETNRREFKDYAALYNVRSYPTFIVYDNAKEVDRTAGRTNKDWFLKRLKKKKDQEEEVEKPDDKPYDGL